MKSIISVFLILVMMISCFFGSFSAAADDLQNTDSRFTDNQLSSQQIQMLSSFVEAETEWIASLQLENGAIPMTKTADGIVTVNPYFADIAAMALLENAEKYSDAVKKYLDWHFLHLNSAADDYNGVDGTIYDYSVEIRDGRVVSENIVVTDGKASYDSTDSYAATFLILLSRYYNATSDGAYINEHSDDIIRVTEAMLKTLDRGLTYAKPDYEVKYLMDNCEVYEGLGAVLSIFENAVSSDKKDCLTYLKAKYAFEWLGQSIEKKLWNENGGYYYPGIFADGKPAYEFSWQEFYPSATAQLFPIIHNVIPPDSIRAVSLYESFCEAYSWQKLEIPSEFCWGAMALAAAVMNDTDSVLSYINSYILYSADRAYPLYNADAARVCIAAAYLINN